MAAWPGEGSHTDMRWHGMNISYHCVQAQADQAGPVNGETGGERLGVAAMHCCAAEPFHPHSFPCETLTADFSTGVVTPNQLRWRPFPIPSEPGA